MPGRPEVGKGLREMVRGSCPAFAAGALRAQETRVVLDRGGSTIVLEPYAPNIIRVTLSLLKQPALAPPDMVLLPRLPLPAGAISKVRREIPTAPAASASPSPPTSQASPCLELDIAKYFNGSAPGAHITFSTADGTRLLDMQGWSMAVPNHKDGTAGVLNDKRPGDADFYQVGATFASP
jgi:alpha-D-xyloside xylohydrolase